MTQKLAVKRLTQSDLTLFYWHFVNRRNSNQKAINLNKDVFISQLYPGLQGLTEREIPVSLQIYGPNALPAYNLARKILLQQKNWRLDGEYINNPENSPNRFNILEPNDIAILDFVGELEPTSLRIVFLSQNAPQDKTLHQEFSVFLGVQSMKALSITELENIFQHTSLHDDSHPIFDLSLNAALEDAAQSGIEGTQRLRARPSGRQMRQSDLERARQQAAQIGRQGELIVNDYLASLKTQGAIRDFEWTSEQNAISPYDFTLYDNEGSIILIEVKSTSNAFTSRFHVSYNELLQMNDNTHQYDIYRVYNIEEQGAQLRIARNVANIAHQIIQVVSSLPAGVSPDSFSILPTTLPFEPPITLISTSDEENES